MVKKSRQRNAGGFTLVEVMVASFTVLVLLASMLTALLAGRHSANLARHRSQALNLLQEQMEGMQSLGYDGLVDKINEFGEQYDYYGDQDWNYAWDYEFIPGDGDGASEYPGPMCYRYTMIYDDGSGDGILDVLGMIMWQENVLGNDTWEWERLSMQVADLGGL